MTPQEIMARKRECGECRACCVIPPIPELQKAAMVPCQNLAKDVSAANCGIYGTRPQCCKKFECLWLWDRKGLLKDTERPDKIGVMLSILYGTALSGPEGIMTAWTLHTGQPLSADALIAIERVARIGPVLLYDGMPKGLFGDPDEIGRLTAKLKG